MRLCCVVDFRVWLLMLRLGSGDLCFVDFRLLILMLRL